MGIECCLEIKEVCIANLHIKLEYYNLSPKKIKLEYYNSLLVEWAR